MSVSLHEIAPRLAVARDVERWNVWVAGDDALLGVRDGDRWAETLTAEHSTGRCRCGGTEDHYRIVRRILVGPNKGVTSLILHEKCRSCGASMSSHR